MFCFKVPQKNFCLRVNFKGRVKLQQKIAFQAPLKHNCVQSKQNRDETTFCLILKGAKSLQLYFFLLVENVKHLKTLSL